MEEKFTKNMMQGEERREGKVTYMHIDIYKHEFSFADIQMNHDLCTFQLANFCPSTSGLPLT